MVGLLIRISYRCLCDAMMRSVVFLAAPTLCQLTPHTARRTSLDIGADARVVVDETRDAALVDDAQQVADSVDAYDAHGWEEASIARSEIADARGAVSRELLDAVQDRARRNKRVRIRSPVLVIETPERRVERTPSRVPNGAAQDPCPVEADKSRVVLGELSDDEHKHVDGTYVPDVHVSNVRCSTRKRDVAEGGSVGAMRACDLSLLAGARASDSTRAFAPVATRKVHAIQAPAPPSATQHVDSTPPSASTLPIRAPMPGNTSSTRVPQTCRFTFFSKHARPSSCSVQHDNTIDHTRSLPTANDNARPCASHADVTMPTSDGRIQESTSLVSLPTMNVFAAPHDSALFNASLSRTSSAPCDDQAQQSIQPPPTLHFSLAHVTRVERILAHPTQFVGSQIAVEQMRAGGVTNKVNLLVVVKEVGEVELVRDRVRVDSAGQAGQATRSTRGRLHDGRTERVALVVMDGSISSIARWVDDVRSSDISVVDEVESKCLLQLVVWGELAREWVASATLDVSSQQASRCSPSLRPTPLRPGDVISVCNVSLSRSTACSTCSTRGLRRGTRLGSHPIAPTAHASPANNSTIELCYRSTVLSPLDNARNFHPSLAAFDLKSKNVDRLRRLWLSSC